MGKNSLGGIMFKSITIEEVGVFLAFLVSLIGSVEFLCVKFRKNIEVIIKSQLEEVSNRLDKLENQNKELELNADKNFLVRFLSDVEQESVIDDIEEERFYETYKRYHDLGGNSYIDHKVSKLKEEGKL